PGIPWSGDRLHYRERYWGEEWLTWNLLESGCGCFRPVPGLHELAMIKMQQVCHSANKVFLVFIDTAVGKGYPPDALQQGLLLLLIQMIVNLPGKLIQRRGVLGVGQGIVQDFLSLFPGNLMSLHRAVHNGLKF